MGFAVENAVKNALEYLFSPPSAVQPLHHRLSPKCKALGVFYLSFLKALFGQTACGLHNTCALRNERSFAALRAPSNC